MTDQMWNAGEPGVKEDSQVTDLVLPFTDTQGRLEKYQAWRERMGVLFWISLRCL